MTTVRAEEFRRARPAGAVIAGSSGESVFSPEPEGGQGRTVVGVGPLQRIDVPVRTAGRAAGTMTAGLSGGSVFLPGRRVGQARLMVTDPSRAV